MYRVVYQDQFGSWISVASGDLSDAVAPMLAAGPSQYPTVEYTWDGAEWQTQTWNTGVSASDGSLPNKPCDPGSYEILGSCVDPLTAGGALGLLAFGAAKILGASLLASVGVGALVLLGVTQVSRFQSTLT